MIVTNDLNKLAEILAESGLVLIPTDTVWGVAALISRPKGIAKLYQIKQRPLDKPTALLVANQKMAVNYGQLNSQARNLARKYWPGALTIVVDKQSDQVPDSVTGGTDTVGLRAPAYPQVIKLINLLGEALVVSSANKAGLPPASQRNQIDPDLLAQATALLDGEALNQPPSTVIDARHQPVRILRSGSIAIK